MTRMQLDSYEPEMARALAARQGYIAWRMADLPGVYQQLLPVTADAKELWGAERAIRAQHAADLAFSAQPWRRVGPSCSPLLDFSALDATTRIEFGLEVSIPVGQTDIPKPGREDEVTAEIARQRESGGGTV